MSLLLLLLCLLACSRCSRRSTWELLRRARKGRTIVLTTHFMGACVVCACVRALP